jgi:hypothetical protein
VTTTEQPARVPLTARHPWLLNGSALLLVVAGVALQAVGIVRASSGDWQGGTLFAWLAIGATAVAVIVALVAIIRRRSWKLGAVVLLAALATNPYLLARLLNLLG